MPFTKDAFGKPRNGDWSDMGGLFDAKLDFADVDASGNVIGDIDISKRGFTDHEHLDEMQLIHMNGRMYDYNNGRFLSVDPFIQNPTSTQSMNPYTYIFNNPLSGTDPTGYKSEIEKERVTGSHIAQDKRKGPGNRRKPKNFKSGAAKSNGSETKTARNVLKAVDKEISNLKSVVSNQMSNAGPSRQDKISVLNNSKERKQLGELQSYRKHVAKYIELSKHCEPNCKGTIPVELIDLFAQLTQSFGVNVSMSTLGGGTTSSSAATVSQNRIFLKITSKGLDDAVFAQVKAKGGKAFSEEGQIKFTRLAGQQITTVDDLTNALTSGIIKPSQIPLDYVMMGGQQVIANTRTSTALINASIPKSQWFGINRTGLKAYDDITFDSLVQRQLNKNYGGSVKNARRD